MLIPRPPKIHSLDRVLSRGQTLELPYLGRNVWKKSRGGQKVSRHMVVKLARHTRN